MTRGPDIAPVALYHMGWWRRTRKSSGRHVCISVVREVVWPSRRDGPGGGGGPQGLNAGECQRQHPPRQGVGPRTPPSPPLAQPPTLNLDNGDSYAALARRGTKVPSRRHTQTDSENAYRSRHARRDPDFDHPLPGPKPAAGRSRRDGAALGPAAIEELEAWLQPLGTATLAAFEKKASAPDHPGGLADFRSGPSTRPSAASTAASYTEETATAPG